MLERLGSFTHFKSLFIISNLESELFRTRRASETIDVKLAHIYTLLEVDTINNRSSCELFLNHHLTGQIRPERPVVPLSKEDIIDLSNGNESHYGVAAHHWVDLPYGPTYCTVGVLKQELW